MSDSPVLFELHKTTSGRYLAVVTLNAEDTLNALTLEMVELLYGKLVEWQAHEDVVAVFLQAAGSKAFCAGGDIQKLHESAVSSPGGPCEYAETFFAREYRLDYLIQTYSKPLICWGHGIVMGGGLGLMVGSRHRVVTEKTRMAMPEITIALYPDVGGSYFLNQAPGRTGLYLALTAASMNATDSLFVGYGDHFITHDRKALIIDALLEMAWTGEAETDSELVTGLLKSQESESLETMPDGNVEKHYDVIQQLTDYPTLPQIVEAITQYPTDGAWLNKGAMALASGSPLSACNIYQALKLMAGKNLRTVCQFELALSTNVVRHPEFAEGVRALLIDKDRNPAWMYQSVTEVPADLLEKMITPPWEINPLSDLD